MTYNYLVIIVITASAVELASVYRSYKSKFLWIWVIFLVHVHVPGRTGRKQPVSVHVKRSSDRQQGDVWEEEALKSAEPSAASFPPNPKPPPPHPPNPPTLKTVVSHFYICESSGITVVFLSSTVRVSAQQPAFPSLVFNETTVVHDLLVCLKSFCSELKAPLGAAGSSTLISELFLLLHNCSSRLLVAAPLTAQTN